MIYVDRTCSEVDAQATGAAEGQTQGKPLSHYADSAAWVLLGPAGAGKTVAFQQEAKNPDACYVTARDFITLKRDDWCGKTLFIDALDEVRAGASDGRTPLDQIRAKLDCLRCSNFRISCREADWFGTDRADLEAVSPDGSVLVLRLDPLTEGQVKKLLRNDAGVSSTDAFLRSADEAGLSPLLQTPQGVDLLAKAVAGGKWPETRRETFELACERLASEQNERHVQATVNEFGIEALLDAAGRLCAIQLLTGSVGYAARTADHPSGYIPLRDTPSPPQALLSAALHTRLFDWPEDQCAAPMHRQIAEFLAARHIARLIREKLPPQRVLALMTGEDDRVVSPLRGLSAWLAAHSDVIRSECIKSDPLGVILYGDVKRFDTDTKRRLIEDIKKQAKRDPWILHQDYELDARWGDLATPDAERLFREVLEAPGRDDAGQSVAEALLVAMRHSGIPLRSDRLLMDFVRDSDRWPQARGLALESFIRQASEEKQSVSELFKLLHDVEAGVVSDPLDSLLGILLRQLYPEHIAPCDVCQYLHEPRKPMLFSYYQEFWTYELLDHSTDEQLGAVIDGLVRTWNEWKNETLPRTCFHRVMMRLLRGPMKVDAQRLFDWLRVMDNIPDVNTERAFAEWFEKNPIRYKDLTTIAVERDVDAGYPLRWLRLRNCQPEDFGIWCLKSATCTTAPTEDAAKLLLGLAFSCLRRGIGCKGFSETIATQQLRGHPALQEHWQMLQEQSAASAKQASAFLQEQEAAQVSFDEQARQRRQHWQSFLRGNRAKILANCPPRVLNSLALVYWDEYVDLDLEGKKGDLRLRSLLQDDALVEIALKALRNTPSRNDLPGFAEAAAVDCHHIHPLAWPFLAAMELIPPQPNALPLNKDGMRLALAFLFHAPIDPPGWYTSLLDTQPEFVAATLVDYCRVAFSRGKVSPFPLQLANDPAHEAVAKLAIMDVLDLFPPRNADGLGTLRQLMLAAIKYAPGELAALIERKLAQRSLNPSQRVHWLCCGLTLGLPDCFQPLAKMLTGRARQHHVRNVVELMHDGVLQANKLDIDVVALLFEAIASRYPPDTGLNPPFGNAAIHATDVLEKLIDRLASETDTDATVAVDELVEKKTLHHWVPKLRHVRTRHREARREANFDHATVEKVLNTLSNGLPANAADLAALAIDRIATLSRRIRDGNTSDWRQYWNKNKGGGWTRCDENECRNRLLSDLKFMLPDGVTAEHEVPYADECRPDIRLGCNGFNVPVEVKRSDSGDLWGAINKQLIPKYTRDQNADGNGIYLVFWFGQEGCRKPPRKAVAPSSSQELEAQLRESLTAAEAQRISVIVIDVSKPPSKG